MRFHKEIELHGGLDEVRELLLDPGFREQVAREAGAVEVAVQVTRDGDTAHAVIDTEQPTTGMPSLATRFLGGRLAIHQEEDWSSPTGGSLEVTIPGQPGRITGTVALTERDGLTVQTVDADVSVRIPLVGGKVEKLIGSVLGHVLKLQAQVGNERLRSGA